MAPDSIKNDVKLSIDQQLAETRERIDQAQNWGDRWRAVLDYAKLRPSMFIGVSSVAHQQTIINPIELVWNSGAFSNPRSVDIICSPTEYLIVCHSGPLLTTIVNLIDWHQELLDTSFRLLRTHLRTLPNPRTRWQQSFTSAGDPGLDKVMLPVYLAKRFFVALQTDDGYWFQSYKEGWPLSPPLLSNYQAPVGFVVAGALDDEWFTGLPFTQESVKNLMQTHFKTSVTVKWHSIEPLIRSLPVSVITFDRWMNKCLKLLES